MQQVFLGHCPLWSGHKRHKPGGGGGGGGGGYSLCDGWYICAAVLTPFFHFGRIEHDLFGVFFSSTNSKAIFWGTKTTNFYKNRSFWPQIQFFPRSFWVQFSAASGTPPSVFRPSTPPGTQGQGILFPLSKQRWEELKMGTINISLTAWHKPNYYHC